MNPRIEDHLLFECIRTECHRDSDPALIAAAYERLLDAIRRDARLGGVLADEAEHAGADADEAMLAEVQRRQGQQSAYFFSRASDALEDTNELAMLLEFLLDVDAIEHDDAQAFLVRRAEATRRRAAAPTDGEPAWIGVLDDRLDDLLDPLALEERWVLLEGLGMTHVLSEERYIQARDALHALQSAASVPALLSVGKVRETLLGPPQRYCGIRILAAELCTNGVVIHAHHAINPVSESGEHEPLADEAVPDHPSWPIAPPLRLYDSNAMVYRGTFAAGQLIDLERLNEGDADSAVARVVFVPAVPPGAAHVWLASDDGDIRIELQ